MPMTKSSIYTPKPPPIPPDTIHPRLIPTTHRRNATEPTTSTPENRSGNFLSRMRVRRKSQTRKDETLEVDEIIYPPRTSPATVLPRSKSKHRGSSSSSSSSSSRPRPSTASSSPPRAAGLTLYVVTSLRYVAPTKDPEVVMVAVCRNLERAVRAAHEAWEGEGRGEWRVVLDRREGEGRLEMEGGEVKDRGRECYRLMGKNAVGLERFGKVWVSGVGVK